MGQTDQGRDFFISFAGVDRPWADWIATELERVGYSTWIQSFDFRPGTDFAHEMQRASSTASRTIAILSPAYFNSPFGEAEWRVAFTKDPTGERGLLLPVRVQSCEPPGLLATRVYVDLVDLDETAARSKLLAAVDQDRPRPNLASFPGPSRGATAVVQYPGIGARAAPRSETETAAGRLPPGHRLVAGLPDFVPSRVRDRTTVCDALLELLTRPEPMLAELRGASGIGKTAVAAEVARNFPGPAAFLTASGYVGVAAATVLDALAAMVTRPAERQLLQERLYQEEADSLTKLDDVLATLEADRVLLVIDSAEELVASDGRLHGGLATLFTEIARSHAHGVRVLLVTTLPIHLRGVRSIVLEGALPPRDYRLFVEDLTAAQRGARPILSVHELQLVTLRHPRRTEILVGIPTGAVPASDLLAMARPVDLTTAIMATLDAGQAQAVTALAVMGRQVGVGAVAALTGEPSAAVERALGELVSRRIVRQHADLYQLPHEEAHCLAQSLDPDVLARLRNRAAEHFEAAAQRGRPERLDECVDWFNAIDLHIVAGNPEHALALMAQIDEDYLREWGHSDALAPWLRDLRDRLTSDRDRVLHASLSGRALAQQGMLDAGIAMVLQAGVRNVSLSDTDAQLALLIQLAGYLFRAGRIARATEQYNSVIKLAPTVHRRTAEARTGLALCQAQIGDFSTAIRNIEAARADLGGRPTRDRDTRLVDVRLEYNRALIDLELGDDRQCLIAVSQARAAAIELEAEPLVARCDDLVARVRLYRGQPNAALAPAKEACRVAARIGNPDLSRIAGITLATTLLRLEECRDALVAANSAARYNRSLFVAEALAVQGVAAFRVGDASDRARLAFTQAVRIANKLLMQESNNYRARETSAIALAGLALLGSESEEWQAVVAYRHAMDASRAPGALHRRRELFESLIAEQSDDVLPQVRELLS